MFFWLFRYSAFMVTFFCFQGSQSHELFSFGEKYFHENDKEKKIIKKLFYLNDVSIVKMADKLIF